MCCWPLGMDAPRGNNHGKTPNIRGLPPFLHHTLLHQQKPELRLVPKSPSNHRECPVRLR